jgi:hypothetical protein
VAAIVAGGMNEARALQHAAWAGAVSVVLLAAGVALTYLGAVRR